MSDNTKIEWADATVNAINGCTVTSPGCTNCYAMKLAGTRLRNHPTRQGLTTQTKAGPVWNGEVRLIEQALLQPLKWKRPRRIFWNAHGDTFHDSVPDEWIDRVMAVCALTPQHTHMILTKRSKRMREYLTARNGMGNSSICKAINDIPAHLGNRHGALEMPLPNLLLGVSVEDQTRADERIPDLLATPAAIRFISAEPLLGAVDLTRIMDAGAVECFHNKEAGRTFGGKEWPETRSSLNSLTGHFWGEDLIDGRWEGWCGEHEQPSPGFGEPGYYRALNLVITGGENGPRPIHPDWARSLRDQCAAANVPFNFKQWGSFLPANQIAADGEICSCGSPNSPPQRIGKKRAGRLLDGVEHNGMPGEMA